MNDEMCYSKALRETTKQIRKD